MNQDREVTAAEQRGTGANLRRSLIGLVSDSAPVPHLPPPPGAARMRGNIPASVSHLQPLSPSPTSFSPMRYLLTAALLAAACSLLFTPSANAEDDFPLGLKKLVWPEDNKHSAEKVELGKQLYFDKRLSRDDTISCASCHDPKKGWSNGEAFA